MMTVYILSNDDFVGDNNQLLGVQHELLLSSIICTEQNFQISHLLEGDRVLVAGSHGIQIAAKIKQANPNVHITWTGHLIFNEFSTIDASYWPDIIALPEAIITPTFEKHCPSHCTLIKTNGVSHNVNDASVQNAFNIFTQQQLLPSYPNYIGIIIAGDAPTSDGTQLYFDQKDAEKQANAISAYIKNSAMDLEQTAVMITNGPRTGKHDCSTQEVLKDSHRYNNLDPISATFITTLKRHFSEQHLFFYDFQFGQPSAYQPMMHLLHQTTGKALWFVPAESSSMVTESSYLSAKNIPVIVYTPVSANPDHMALIREAKHNGLISMLDEPLLLDLEKPIVRLAATQIADELKSSIRLENNPQARSVEEHDKAPEYDTRFFKTRTTTQYEVKKNDGAERSPHF